MELFAENNPEVKNLVDRVPLIRTFLEGCCPKGLPMQIVVHKGRPSHDQCRNYRNDE
jgi:hypothetical protein